MTADTTTHAHGALEAAGLAGGPFTRAESLAAGITDHGLRQLVAEGSIRGTVRGVYVPTALPDSVVVRAQSLAKIAARHVVVVDRTAAWLWGVSAYSLTEESGVVPIDAFSLRGRNRVRRPTVHGGIRDLLPGDWIDFEGVRVTSPLRTALDLACGLGRLEAVAVVDALMRAQGLTRADLYAQLQRYRGRRGVIQAREVVSLVDPRAESQGESFTRVVMVDEGLPAPSLQVWVYDEDWRALFRLDHAYEELQIAVEYDGEEHHSSPEDREEDAKRRAWLRANGWIVIVVTKRDLATHSRIWWIDEVRQARRQRIAELRTSRTRPRSRGVAIPRQRWPRD